VTLAAKIDARAMQAYASQKGATFWNSRLFLEKFGAHGWRVDLREVTVTSVTSSQAMRRAAGCNDGVGRQGMSRGGQRQVEA
jgi:hypothetical protein